MITVSNLRRATILIFMIFFVKYNGKKCQILKTSEHSLKALLFFDKSLSLTYHPKQVKCKIRIVVIQLKFFKNSISEKISLSVVCES